MATVKGGQTSSRYLFVARGSRRAWIHRRGNVSHFVSIVPVSNTWRVPCSFVVHG